MPFHGKCARCPRSGGPDHSLLFWISHDHPLTIGNPQPFPRRPQRRHDIAGIHHRLVRIPPSARFHPLHTNTHPSLDGHPALHLLGFFSDLLGPGDPEVDASSGGCLKLPYEAGIELQTIDAVPPPAGLGGKLPPGGQHSRSRPTCFASNAPLVVHRHPRPTLRQPPGRRTANDPAAHHRYLHLLL